MKRKVYLSLLSMGLACMAVTLLISTWFFWRSTQHQIQQELTMTMDVVETALEEGHDTSLYLKKIGIHHTNGLRITWINARGDVLNPAVQRVVHDRVARGGARKDRPAIERRFTGDLLGAAN